MDMILYHGSKKVIPAPSMSKGRVHNDFGRGFYCTYDREMAMGWACGHGDNGFLNSYLLHVEGLNVLDLTDGTHPAWNWISLCVSNRVFDVSLESVTEESIGYILSEHPMDISGTDVIIGHRADCSYHSMLQSFLENGTTLGTIERMLSCGGSEVQIALISEKAFDNLSFIGSEPVDGSIYHGRWRAHDIGVRRTWAHEWKDMDTSGFMASIMRLDA